MAGTRHGEPTVYKVGSSRNPQERAKALGVGVRLVDVIPTDQPVALERVIQNRFAGKRVSGEWFDLLPDDIAWFNQLLPHDVSELLRTGNRKSTAGRVRKGFESRNPRPGVTGVYVEIPDELLARLDALCESLPLGGKAEHIRLAIRRHVESPPTVDVPELPPVTVPSPAPKKTRRKKP